MAIAGEASPGDHQNPLGMNGRTSRVRLGMWAGIAIAVLGVAGVTVARRSGSNVTPAPSNSPKSSSRGPIRVFSYLPGADQRAESVSRGSDFSNRSVFGISWKFRWSTLEPIRGKFDWSRIDAAIHASRSAGKKVMLRVLAGINTPSWVYEAGAKAFAFPNSDLANPGNYPGSLRMPLPWDSTFLDEWSRFISAIGARYDGDASVYSVQMAGGGFIGEMNVPHGGDAVARWRRAGWSDDVMVGVWRRIISAYRDSFPHTPLNLDVGEPLGAGQSHVMAPVVQFVRSTYPGSVYIQQNGLKASYAEGINETRSIIRDASGWTTVGYQMYGGKGLLDAKTGDRATAFRVAAEDGASYVEVYSSDLRDPALRDAVASLAAGRS